MQPLPAPTEPNSYAVEAWAKEFASIVSVCVCVFVVVVVGVLVPNPLEAEAVEPLPAPAETNIYAVEAWAKEFVATIVYVFFGGGGGGGAPCSQSIEQRAQDSQLDLSNGPEA